MILSMDHNVNIVLRTINSELLKIELANQYNSQMKRVGYKFIISDACTDESISDIMHDIQVLRVYADREDLVVETLDKTMGERSVTAIIKMDTFIIMDVQKSIDIIYKKVEEQSYGEDL